jgi:anti-sigma-K factor RskA
MDYSQPERADALAAEYVAGTLRGAARRRFEALLPSHPALRSAVRRWQDRLIPLTTAVPAVAPPARVWQGIEGRLWPEPALPPWWQRLAPWRALSGTALAAAVGLAVFVSQPAPVQAPVVVVLESTGTAAVNPATIVASFSGDGRAMVTRTLSPVSLTADRVLELWSVPAQGNPRSLGLISANGATVLSRDRLPPSLLKGNTAALAVSVEPPGGSPTGVPTGPVVFAGKLQL